MGHRLGIACRDDLPSVASRRHMMHHVGNHPGAICTMAPRSSFQGPGAGSHSPAAAEVFQHDVLSLAKQQVKRNGSESAKVPEKVAHSDLRGFCAVRHGASVKSALEVNVAWASCPSRSHGQDGRATAPVGERGNFAPALPERYAQALHAWGRAGFPTSMGTSPVPVLSHQARHHRCIKAAVRCNLPSSVIRMS